MRVKINIHERERNEIDILGNEIKNRRRKKNKNECGIGEREMKWNAIVNNFSEGIFVVY